MPLREWSLLTHIWDELWVDNRLHLAHTKTAHDENASVEIPIHARTRETFAKSVKAIAKLLGWTLNIRKKRSVPDWLSFESEIYKPVHNIVGRDFGFAYDVLLEFFQSTNFIQIWERKILYWMFVWIFFSKFLSKLIEI